MNTKEMLRMLSEYFSEFECHVAFLEEFKLPKYYDKKIKEHWEKQQVYTKKLLNYLDGYWNTSMEDRTITPELMKKLKTVPVKTFMNKQI